jgi:hypothetical protein
LNIPIQCVWKKKNNFVLRKIRQYT